MDWSRFNKLKILIVDDDQFTRELIKTILKEVKSISVDLAINGVEALELTKQNHYDMFLVDLYMPKMGGKEFISYLKRDDKLKSLPVVLMTTDRLTKKEIKSIGTNYSLSKPFNFKNLLKNIHDFFSEELLLNGT